MVVCHPLANEHFAKKVTLVAVAWLVHPTWFTFLFMDLTGRHAPMPVVLGKSELCSWLFELWVAEQANVTLRCCSGSGAQVFGRWDGICGALS